MQTFEAFIDQCAYYGLELIHTRSEYEEAFACGDVNGCGAKGGIDVPDTMWGVYVGAPCNIHDVDWKLAKNYQDLVDANQRFRRNIEKVLDKESANAFTLWFRLNRMSRYYRMVKLVGTPLYAKERPYGVLCHLPVQVLRSDFLQRVSSKTTFHSGRYLKHLFFLSPDLKTLR